MSGFLYFIPETGFVGLEQAREAGIGYAFEKQPARLQTHKGPSGSPGVIVSDAGWAEPFGHHPERQTWRKLPRSEVWVGMYTDTPPGPADLARKEQLDGHLVRLGDGRDWLCPIARCWNEGNPFSRLPVVSGVNDEGEWVPKALRAEHEALWETACRWWDALIKADVEPGAEQTGTAHFDFAGLNAAALLAVQANYKIGMIEVDMLCILDTNCVPNVLGALVDWPTVVRWWHEMSEKKTAEPSAPAG